MCNISMFFGSMILKAQFVLLSLLHAVFLLFCFYSMNTSASSLGPRSVPIHATQCKSAYVQMRWSTLWARQWKEAVSVHMGKEGVGVPTTRIYGCPGNSVRGPLASFFGQRIGCWKECYGQPETAEKMLSV